MRRRVRLRVGALLRRQVRRELMSEGISFREDKGLLDSLFILDCSADECSRVQAWVSRINAA